MHLRAMIAMSSRAQPFMTYSSSASCARVTKEMQSTGHKSTASLIASSSSPHCA